MEWLTMGKHGFFVWGSYGIGIGLLIGLAIFLKRSHKKIRLDIERRWERDEQDSQSG